MNTKQAAIMGVAVTCIIGSATWYSSVSGTIAQATYEEPTATRPVPTERVMEIPDQTYRSFPGIVRANERVKMAFSIDGLLTELNAIEGRPVAKGAVIAQLDQRDAKNAYQAATARYEVAKKDLERSQTLIDRQIIPPAEFDLTKSAYDIAAAEMRIRKKAYDDTTLVAPFDGIVSKRYVENFQHIKAKDDILSLKDISRIEVVIHVPERQIAHGGGNSFREVQVRFDAVPTNWYNAVIKEFSIESDPVTGTYDVVVGLIPPGDVEIFPGMTATVRAPVPSANNDHPQNRVSYIVPLAAVVGDNDESSFVWIIPEAEGSPEKRKVLIGKIRKQGIEIHEGLNVGELVAVAGVHSLTSDMLVRPAQKKREGLDQ